VEQLFAQSYSKLKREVQQATHQNGRDIQGAIVQRIAGNQVVPATGARFREWKAKHGYSTHTLIMTGSLVAAVKYEKKNWREGFVGVNRNAQGKTGNLASIAAVHEYGRSDGSMPARPFIKPVMEQIGQKVVQRYQEAIEKAFKT
jgi:hypothetical protein